MPDADVLGLTALGAVLVMMLLRWLWVSDYLWQDRGTEGWDGDFD